ncbi:hypothetical protein [Desulfosporosinus fructosivorans]
MTTGMMALKDRNIQLSEEVESLGRRCRDSINFDRIDYWAFLQEMLDKNNL